MALTWCVWKRKHYFVSFNSVFLLNQNQKGVPFFVKLVYKKVRDRISGLNPPGIELCQVAPRA